MLVRRRTLQAALRYRNSCPVLADAVHLVSSAVKDGSRDGSALNIPAFQCASDWSKPEGTAGLRTSPVKRAVLDKTSPQEPFATSTSSPTPGVGATGSRRVSTSRGQYIASHSAPPRHHWTLPLPLGVVNTLLESRRQAFVELLGIMARCHGAAGVVSSNSGVALQVIRERPEATRP